MRMGDKDSFYRSFAQILFHQFLCSPCHLTPHAGIENYPTRVSLNEGNICHIIAADLIYSVRYLEKPICVVVDDIFPQARVHGVGSMVCIFDKSKCILAPDDTAVIAGYNE